MALPTPEEAARIKAKADREPWRDDRFIKKRWAKKAEKKRRGAAMIASTKAGRKAVSKGRRARRRAFFMAGGSNPPDYDEDYRLEHDQREDT